MFDSDGVYSLVDNPLAENSNPGPAMGRKVLVHRATNVTMATYDKLNDKLLELGWCPYFQNQHVQQYHRSDDKPDLITLPSFFCDIRTTHMYDIVVKTRSAFEVRDVD